MGDPAATFQFVSVGKSGQPANANDRKTIRKAAMLAFRRKERIERVKAFAAECAAEATESQVAISPKTAPKKAKSPDPLSPSGPITRAAKPNLTPMSRTWQPGPLSDINIPLLPQLPQDMGYFPEFSNSDLPDTAYVFDYFIYEIVPVMLPFVGHNQRVLRLFFTKNLMRDRVILQAALSHAAVHLDVANNRQPGKIATILTKEAIRLINERLATKPFVPENELIGAVALVAANSNMTGDLAESQIHMDGLKEMVRMRGGRDSLRDDIFVQAFVSWADLTSANLTRSKPRFAISNSSETSSESTLPKLHPCDMDEIFGLVEELRQLTDLKKGIDSREASIWEIMEFDTQRNDIEERFITLQYTFTTHDLDFGDIFLHSICIAASIYMYLAFRNFRPNFPNLQKSKQDLLAAIAKAETLYASLPSLPESDFPYAEKLLWVLFIGGTLASNESETTWFTNRLTMVVPWTQVRSWEDAETCLKSVLWIDKLRNNACMSLWHELEDFLGFNSGKIVAIEDEFAGSSTSIDPILFT